MKLSFMVMAVEYFSKFFSGQARSVRAKLNILVMMLLKGVSILCGFLIVPLTLQYLDATTYGIWLTLSSIVGWFTFFDIGLGNGLRNKFAEAMAHHDSELARIYISTTYFFLSIIICTVFLLFCLINYFLDWAIILNAPSAFSLQLSVVVFITFSFFCMRFVFGLIGTILIADQKPAMNSLIEVSSNLISLGFIFILVKTTKSSLVNLSIMLGMATACVPMLASWWLFSGMYKQLRPSLKYLRISHGRGLMSLGGRFFILQIGALVIFSTSNILIAQLFSPGDVVPYNIAFKYYNLVSMVLAIILAPFWSAYTEAYVHGDIAWIQRTIVVLKRVWIVAAVGVFIMSIEANAFYHMWIGNSITIPSEISVSMGIYVLMNVWCNIYVNIINGTGKIDLQIIAATSMGIVNIPLAIVLSKYLHFGIPGVILAPCLCMLPWCFVWPVQVKKILSGTGTGIWIK
ncbi:MAG: MATE family efflux transporter [Bacteroidota bacterium]